MITIVGGNEQSAIETTMRETCPALTSNRVFGADRYETAARISQAGFPSTASVVYVATGENYPDALATAPAATVHGGPLLLTLPAVLPEVISRELTRLKPKRVVVGGTEAVSTSVFKAIKAIVPNTTRIAGADRFETARLIVAKAFPSATAAFVATGLNFPDALSASAAGGVMRAPVVLVDGNAPAADPATTSLLRGLGVKTITVVGGEEAVSSGIQKSLSAITAVTRTSGYDRFDTSAAVNAAAFERADTAYLATGLSFPDALAGAALAGSRGAPLFVVQPQCVPHSTFSELDRMKVKTVTLLGGPGALNASMDQLTECRW